jgi:uncharacterized protein YPO0396
MHDPTLSPLALPGYRLAKVQVMNWGTFDSSKGQIHTVRPDGRTSLLIGQNGSGKSTLVDSILTLLVRPGVRNYNVAAGSSGGKRERDERSYLLGAFGHASSDSENKASTLYLRKEGRHLSILLAYFHNAQTGRGFTMAQVLYSGVDGKVEKIFCFAKGEKDIAIDFEGLKSIDQICPKLESRGIKTTRTFLQYHKWMLAETQMRGKAMDIFNQTVAVKDIRSLTEFIRCHMLEASDWQDRIDDILNHFQQLSDSHRMLVDAREQAEALQPVVAAGVDYQNLKASLLVREKVERASEAFFRTRTAQLFGQARAARLAEQDRLSREVCQTGQELEQCEDQIRRLRNDIEHAGGERLRSLPFLIQQREQDSRRRRERAERYQKALTRAGLAQPIEDAAAFEFTGRRLSELRAEVDELVQATDQSRFENALKAHDLNQRREQLEREIKALEERRSNIPESFLRLRRDLCQGLGLEASSLPFAAELMMVRPSESRWQSAAEMALRSFGLSLLVPAQHYREVSSYLDRIKLRDAAGRGQRLVYHRVGEIPSTAHELIQSAPADSLLQKLDFSREHPLSDWVRAEVAQRFNFRCCDNLEAFLEQRTMALTADRHIKSSTHRHEKDDREQVSEPRHFILGWDNRSKLDTLRSDLGLILADIQRLLVQAQHHAEHIAQLQARREAIQQALEVKVFAEIDHSAPDREISALLKEKESLENTDQIVATLTQQLQATNDRKHQLRQRESEVTKRLGVIEREIAQASQFIEAAEARLAEAAHTGELESHRTHFPQIESDLASSGIVLTPETLFAQENAFLANLRESIARIRSELEPLEKSLLQTMGRFLRKFRNFEHELRDDPAYIEDFIRLHDTLEHEDLPKHEQRFKERLNEKVTTELGILNNQLTNERAEILTRIATLNRCLETIDYDPLAGTFMQLDPKPVRDKEIDEFQKLLRDCLSEAFDGAFETDEARFQKIEGLINRLREEPRWREKVTDVRRWFDFGARETVRATGEERGYYSDSMGQSGGEKAKLAFTILVAAVVYQFDIDPEASISDRFHFVVVDEMFSKIDDRYAEYAMRLFQKFGLQLLIVAPFDAKAKVTEPFVDYYMHVVKKNNRSRALTMSSGEFNERFRQGGVEPHETLTTPPPLPTPSARVVQIAEPRLHTFSEDDLSLNS